MQKLLILLKSSPYGTTDFGEGLRAAIAFAGMDIDTTILLMDDAAYATMRNQNPAVIGMGSLEEAFRSAREFGAKILVHSEALVRRGIAEKEIVGVKSVKSHNIAELVHDADATITF